MKVRFQCPNCQARLEAEGGDLSSEVRCPQCDTPVQLPSAGIGGGSVIGDFRIERQLGAGAMGEVFLATQLSLDRPVALKILPPAITGDPELLKAFQQEVRTLARLDHSNVATAFAAGEDGGTHYLAMTYVDGEDLAERLERAGPMPEKEALDIILAVARALGYAWDEHALLHRDIKPANIMIDRLGVVKLMDMGFSKSLYEDPSLAEAGMVVGTPNYMSPEQARGEVELTVATDVYALGSTLYHLVTDKLPYEGADAIEVINRRLTERLPSVRTLVPDLSNNCACLIEAMMAHDAADRYADWSEVTRDVERVLAGAPPLRRVSGQGPTGAVPPAQAAAAPRRHDRPPSGRKRKGPRRILIPAAAVLLFLGLAGAALVLVLPPRGAKTTPAPEDLPAAPPGPPPAAVPDPDPVMRQAIADAADAADMDAGLEALALLRARAVTLGLLAAINAAEERLRQRRTEAVDEVLAGLEAQVRDRVKDGDYKTAIRVLMAYDGPHAESSRPARLARAETLRNQAEISDENSTVQALDRMSRSRARVVGLLLRGEAGEAARGLEMLLSDSRLAEHHGALRAELELVNQVVQMPQRVLGAYAKYLGRETTVYLKPGARSLKILQVEPDHVRAEHATPEGVVTRDFGIDDLTRREMVVRLGRRKQPELDLMRGLLAYHAGADETARRYFDQAGVPLAVALTARMPAARQAAREDTAARGYHELLGRVGLDSGRPTGELLDAMLTVRLDPEAARALAHAVHTFRRRFGGTDVADSAETVLHALAGVATQGAADDR